MHLLAPWWWLLSLPLAGTLILLYLLKLRRRDHVVPSVFLWMQALQDLQANAPLQKLRTHLLLALQLLTLLLIVFALSRPVMQWTRQGGQSVVVILDTSASMQSTDVAPSRFEMARKEARNAIDALGTADRMMLITVGGATRALTAFTNDRGTLQAALSRLTISDSRADYREALELVAGLLHNKHAAEHIRVLIISDGAVPPIAIPKDFHLPINYVKVGTRGENLGIVVADVRWQPKNGRYEGLIVAQNFGARPVTCTLEQTLDGRLRDAREIAIPAGEKHTEIVRGLPADGGLFRVNLDVRDDLAVDNSAQVILPKVESTPVTLASAGNYFLSTVLSLDRMLTLKEMATLPSSLTPGTVLVDDNLPLTAMPASVPALVIGPSALGSAIPGERVKQASSATVIDWDRRHPALEHVDFTDLTLNDVTILRPKGTACPIIETDAGPVALVDEAKGRRLIYLGWDLRKSDFPLRAAFPIFISNAVSWLSGTRERAQTLNTRTGEVLHFPFPAGVEQATVTGRAGFRAQYPVRDGLLTIDGVPHTGVYRIHAGTMESRFAANLLDANESNTLPKDKLAFSGEGGRHTATRPGPVRTEGEWWRAVLLLAVLALGVEWWVFHKRIG